PVAVREPDAGRAENRRRPAPRAPVPEGRSDLRQGRRGAGHLHRHRRQRPDLASRQARRRPAHRARTGYLLRRPGAARRHGAQRPGESGCEHHACGLLSRRLHEPAGKPRPDRDQDLVATGASHRPASARAAQHCRPRSTPMNDSKHDPGPLVWVSTIAVTCLLLLALQKILFLVVPFLLALILYYILYPPMQRLILAGVTREASATLVTSVALTLVLMLGYLALPFVTLHLVDWQNAVDRSLQGGIGLLERSLAGLEERYAMLQRAHVATLVGQRLNAFTSTFADQYIEPIALAMAAWTPALLLTPFLSFFLLRDGHHFQRILARAVPNAFFEKTLYLISEVDQAARAYFLGLIQLTILDTITLAFGLWVVG